MTTVVVVGGGTGGALTCGLLATNGYNVISVRSVDIPIIGVGESSTPPLVAALNRMGIAKEFVESNNCWPKYGVVFEGWGDTPMVGGWPVNGRRNECITYLEGLTRGEEIGRIGSEVIDGKMPYMVEADRFYTTIALHIDSTDTSEFIFDKFKDKIQTVYGNVVDVQKGSQGIDHILVDNTGANGGATVLSGDYFIDATGFSRVLIKEMTDSFIPSEIPTNSAVFGEIKRLDKAPNEVLFGWNSMMTTAKTATAGWMWNIPLRDRYGSGYVYSSDFLTEEEAEKEFYDYSGCEKFGHMHYTPGWMADPAVGNCFAVGIAAGFLDALDSPSIGLTVLHIMSFMRNKETPHKHNKYCSGAFNELEEYLLMHYKTCNRTEAFWKSFTHFTEEEMKLRFVMAINSKDWDDRSVSGFTNSATARIITHRMKIDEDYASMIYENIPQAERDQAKIQWIMARDQFVPFSYELFTRHVLEATNIKEREGQFR